MEEKDNIKLEVGEIYAIDFIDLLSCKASPHMEESGKYPYYNMFLGLNSVKCNTNIELCNNFDEICIFVKYVDNGILEEMLTGKTILITSRECNLTAKSFVDFCDCQTQLASVYNSPLIVNSNKIHEVSKDSLDEYLNNKTPELFELLWDEAKKEFHDSLKSFSTLNWQDVLRDDVRYSINQFKNNTFIRDSEGDTEINTNTQKDGSKSLLLTNNTESKNNDSNS